MPAVWSRVDNGHDGWEWGDYMHGMCGRAVQRRVDGGVHGVSGGIGDGHAVRCRRFKLHYMSGILLQRQRNNTVYIMCSWIGDGHVDVSRCHHVHGVCGRAI